MATLQLIPPWLRRLLQSGSVGAFSQLTGSHCAWMGTLGGVDQSRGRFEHATGTGLPAVDTENTHPHTAIVRCRHWAMVGHAP